MAMKGAVLLLFAVLIGGLLVGCDDDDDDDDTLSDAVSQGEESVEDVLGGDDDDDVASPAAGAEDSGDDGDGSGDGSGNGDEAEAMADVCMDLDELETAIADTPPITAGTTVDELNDARDNIQEKFEALQESVGSLADVRMDDVRSAYDAFTDSVDSVEGDDTLAEAAQTVETSWIELGVARDQLSAEVECPAAGTGQ